MWNAKKVSRPPSGSSTHLLTEDGLCLASVATLLPVVASFSYGRKWLCSGNNSRHVTSPTGNLSPSPSRLQPAAAQRIGSNPPISHSYILSPQPSRMTTRAPHNSPRAVPRSAPVPTLGVEGLLPLLVLGDFVRLVLAAFLAVGPTRFRDVHLEGQGEVSQQELERRPASLPFPSGRPGPTIPALRPPPAAPPRLRRRPSAHRSGRRLGWAERAATGADGGRWSQTHIPLPPALTILSAAARREGAPRKRKLMEAGRTIEMRCAAPPSRGRSAGRRLRNGGAVGGARGLRGGGAGMGASVGWGGWQGVTGAGGLWDAQSVGHGDCRVWEVGSRGRRAAGTRR